MPRVVITFATGTKINNWTVVGPGKLINGRYSSSICKCDCGITRAVKNTSLKNGRSLSCGHVGKFERGCASRKKLANGVAAKNAALYHIKKSAQRRGLVVLVSDEEISCLMGQPCYWCGSSNVNESKAKNYNGAFRYNGIDRLDNALGYVSGNIVACCGPCNRTKNVLNKDEFIAYCVNIAVRHGGCSFPMRKVG